jgi:hypothetical protein
LDNHGKVIKSNADFLREISSTLRSHTSSGLPRSTSEPVLKVPFTSIIKTWTPAETTDESDSELMPPTPPDTPTVEVTDWSHMPPKPSEVKYQYEQPVVPKIIIKDHSTSTMTTISAPVSTVLDLSVSSDSDTNVETTSLDSTDSHNTANTNTALVPTKKNKKKNKKKSNKNSVGLPNMDSLTIRDDLVTPNNPFATSSNKSANSVDQNIATEEEITQWYAYHADRAAKSFRYDLREIDLKMDRFVRRINDLNAQCSALNDLMSADASAALNPNTQQHRRTRSTPSVQGNDYFTRKEKKIRDDIKEAFDSLRSALAFYRKQRVAPLELVRAKANVAMPGYWDLEVYGKRRALYNYYNRNKQISKPGDRARYNDVIALLDACTSMSLNQEFVDKIDMWESLMGAMKTQFGANTVIP